MRWRVMSSRTATSRRSRSKSTSHSRFRSTFAIYLYSLVVGGKSRPGEFKAVLRVPGQVVGEYGTFDHSGSRLAVLAAYREDLDVFVLWDASLHERFKHGGNMQVKDSVVAQRRCDRVGRAAPAAAVRHHGDRVRLPREIAAPRDLRP